MSAPFARLSSRRAASLLVAVLMLLTLPGWAADPVVSHLAAMQRPGTKLVDITYDLAADAAVAVSLQISGDGGVTFAVPAIAVSGAVGPTVGAGNAKTLTWNAGADWDGQVSSQVRVKLFVGDGPTPDGTVHVLGGALPADSWAGAQSVDGFYMGKYEVQWGEWQSVRSWAPGRGYDIGEGAGRGAEYPVTDVNWYDALKWCNARSEQEGLVPVYTVAGAPYRTGDAFPDVSASAKGYRLPSEKEWEFVARGGVSTHGYTYSGSNDIDEVAWYGDNSGYAIHAVGTKLANELGLFDMSGNVHEFCFDEYSGTLRVLRGGNFSYPYYGCRVADRAPVSPGDQNLYFGFRAALSSVPSTTATTSDVSVDARDPLAWTLFSAAEAGLAVGDVGLVSLSPLDKLSVVGGGESHDEAAALKLMAADGAASFAERSIEGPALVSFWWRVSSEEVYDVFSYSVDGAVQEFISGEGAWLKRSLSLAAGRHALRWTYRKDGADKNFQDAGFLDELVVVEAYRNLEVSLGGTAVAGSATVDYGAVKQDDPEVAKVITLRNSGIQSLPITANLPASGGFVFGNGQTTWSESLGAGQEATLSLVLQTDIAGPKTALLELVAEGSRTAPPSITLSGSIQGRVLQVAGDSLIRGSFLNSGTAAAWETATTNLPEGASGAAIKTGSTPDNGHSTTGARFDGPGLLRWQWKVSSQQNYDWLVCEVNGVEVAGISTKAAAWQSQVIQIPAGAEARWIYRKDAANQSGTDSGYLAEVRFDKFTAAPVSFIDWSAAQGGIAPLDATGPGKIQGMFAWLGGFDPTNGPGDGQYVPTVSGGFYRYRYAISKTAAGQVQPQVSSDLANWNNRGLSQTLLSENEAAATVELAIPAAGRIYTRLKADLPASGAAPVSPIQTLLDGVGALEIIPVMRHVSVVNGERLGLWYSTDECRHFAELYTGDLPIVGIPAGDYPRDPSLLIRNDAWYVAYTAGSFGAVNHWGLAKSTSKGATWDFVQNTVVAASATGGPNTWGPSWFVDPATGKTHIVVSISPTGYDGFHQPYIQTATNADLTSWSAAVPLTGIIDYTRSIWDMRITYAGGCYYLVTAYKISLTDYSLRIYRATAVAGPYTLYKEPSNYTGSTTSIEQCQLTYLGAGRWRLNYTRPSVGLYVAESWDNLESWQPEILVVDYSLVTEANKHNFSESVQIRSRISDPLPANPAPPPASTAAPSPLASPPPAPSAASQLAAKVGRMD